MNCAASYAPAGGTLLLPVEQEESSGSGTLLAGVNPSMQHMLWMYVCILRRYCLLHRKHEDSSSSELLHSTPWTLPSRRPGDACMRLCVLTSVIPSSDMHMWVPVLQGDGVTHEASCSGHHRSQGNPAAAMPTSLLHTLQK